MLIARVEPVERVQRRALIRWLAQRYRSTGPAVQMKSVQMESVQMEVMQMEVMPMELLADHRVDLDDHEALRVLGDLLVRWWVPLKWPAEPSGNQAELGKAMARRRFQQVPLKHLLNLLAPVRSLEQDLGQRHRQEQQRELAEQQRELAEQQRELAWEEDQRQARKRELAEQQRELAWEEDQRQARQRHQQREQWQRVRRQAIRHEFERALHGLQPRRLLPRLPRQVPTPQRFRLERQQPLRELGQRHGLTEVRPRHRRHFPTLLPTRPREQQALQVNCRQTR